MSRISCVLIALTSILPASMAADSMPFEPGQDSTAGVVMRVANGRIDVTLPDGQLAVSSRDLLEWVQSSADAVAHYYGRFPVPHLTLRISVGRRNGVSHGVTYPKGGGLITIAVGRGTETSDLNDDWILTHEMIHLAFPSMADNHHWIEEGISSYVEPVARAQVGRFAVAEVWKQFILNMPKGEPGIGDRAWTIHTLGDAPTGEEQCFASWRTSRFGNARRTAEDYKTPYGPFWTTVESFPKIGTSKRLLQSGTVQLAPMFCNVFTERCATNQAVLIWICFGRNLA